MNKSPQVVLLDIETSPILGWAWQAFDTNLLKIVENTKVISVSWKQLLDKKTHVRCIADYKTYKKGETDDKELIKEVWDVLDKADVLIGHHSDSFDIKKLNSRFIYYGLNAPSSYQTVDTCKLAKKYFRFDSNSLNNLSIYLGLGEKAPSGLSLWLDCLAGDPDAWLKMKKYNAQDVILLEKLYLTLRPFQDNHPNLNLLSDHSGESCPTCLSTTLSKRGFSLTKTGTKQRYQCNSCGSWSSGPFVKTKDVLS